MTTIERLKPWNTMQEVGDYLRLSLRTVERRIRNGALQAKKDGRLVRIKREWVLTYETADLL
jgi:excisionase family DNA binding protein